MASAMPVSLPLPPRGIEDVMYGENWNRELGTYRVPSAATVLEDITYLSMVPVGHR
jgi:hypothetical protein